MATLKMGSTTVLTDTTLANAVQDNITRLGTITTGVADQYHMSADQTGDNDPLGNWVAGDNGSHTIPAWGAVGSRMSESSGIFTFPVVGIYHVIFNSRMRCNNWNEVLGAFYSIYTTTNNSSYTETATCGQSLSDFSNGLNAEYMSGYCSTLFNVTDTSTHKVKFVSNTTNTATITEGSSTINRTVATFIKVN